MNLHHLLDMVGGVLAAGCIDEDTAVDLVAEYSGMSRALSAALLLGLPVEPDDGADDDWTPIRDWNGWEHP